MVMMSKYLRKRLHSVLACPYVLVRTRTHDAFTFKLNDIETEILSPATTTYWDPTEPTATRPLAFTDHTAATPATYFYTHDLTKNVCELLSASGSIITTYDYTPFGAVTASNSATQNTFMFSSEVLDPETSLVYYNYRHYNPLDGRWISRDPIGEDGGWNLYVFLINNCITLTDNCGLRDNRVLSIKGMHLVYDETLQRFREPRGAENAGAFISKEEAARRIAAYNPSQKKAISGAFNHLIKHLSESQNPYSLMGNVLGVINSLRQGLTSTANSFVTSSHCINALRKFIAAKTEGDCDSARSIAESCVQDVFWGVVASTGSVTATIYSEKAMVAMFDKIHCDCYKMVNKG